MYGWSLCYWVIQSYWYYIFLTQPLKPVGHGCTTWQLAGGRSSLRSYNSVLLGGDVSEALHLWRIGRMELACRWYDVSCKILNMLCCWFWLLTTTRTNGFYTVAMHKKCNGLFLNKGYLHEIQHTHLCRYCMHCLHSCTHMLTDTDTQRALGGSD